MNVIAYKECDYKQLCQYLNKLLEKAEIHTIECITCNRLVEEHDMQNWKPCDSCKENICDECCACTNDKIICQKCAMQKQKELYICYTCEQTFTNLRVCNKCEEYTCYGCSVYNDKNFTVQHQQCHRDW